mgnify:CR=1 FL=1
MVASIAESPDVNGIYFPGVGQGVLEGPVEVVLPEGDASATGSRPRPANVD